MTEPAKPADHGTKPAPAQTWPSHQTEPAPSEGQHQAPHEAPAK